MKIAYQEKVLQNFNAIEKRTNMLRDVADGKRPDVTAEQAKGLLGEIENLVDSSRSIVELVPTE